MIARGTNPAWNQSLLADFASVVSRSMNDNLWYARILELHLNTTVRTISRHFKLHKPAEGVKIPFQLTLEDAASETDSWLEREGPASYEFPFRRDVYLSLTTFIPNRRFSKEEQRWLYQPGDQHLRDLEWTQRIYERSGHDVKLDRAPGSVPRSIDPASAEAEEKKVDEAAAVPSVQSEITPG